MAGLSPALIAYNYIDNGGSDPPLALPCPTIPDAWHWPSTLGNVPVASRLSSANP